MTLHFWTLVANQAARVISSNPRDLSDLHQFFGAESEQEDRMIVSLVDPERPASDLRDGTFSPRQVIPPAQLTDSATRLERKLRAVLHARNRSINLRGDLGQDEGGRM